MALAFQNVVRSTPNGVNNEVFGVVDITLDDSYPDDGWPITPANLGLTSIHHLVPPPASHASFFGLIWDAAASTLLCTEADGDAGAGIEYASANDGLDGDVVRCLFVGT